MGFCDTLEIFWQNKITVGIILCSILVQDFVKAATASEWSSLERNDDGINAFINLTYYIQGAKKVHTEKSEVAKFGLGGKIGSASGIVIHVRSSNRTDEHDGCDYPFGNHIPNDTSWIALIKRGKCTFEKKLENAWRSKASAMVVYDEDTKEGLEQMDLKPSGHSYGIPGILTYKWKGEEIASLVDNGTTVTMYVTVGGERPGYNGINRTSVLFVSISFIVLMIISLAWLVFYYVQRFRYLHAKDRLAQRLCNAAKKALAKIPVRTVRIQGDTKEMGIEGECCAVCIEMYKSGDTLRTLPCKHEFHRTCVDPWLLEHRTCPLCLADILKYYGFIFTGSQESILHLDLDDNGLNSSESRETESPSHEPSNQAQVDEHPQSSVSSSFPSQQNIGSIRKSSLISLTVVAAPSRGSVSVSTPTTDLAEVDSSMKNSPSRSSDKQQQPTSLHENQHSMCRPPSGERTLGQEGSEINEKKTSCSSKSISKSSPFVELEPDIVTVSENNVENVTLSNSPTSSSLQSQSQSFKVSSSSPLPSNEISSEDHQDRKTIVHIEDETTAIKSLNK